MRALDGVRVDTPQGPVQVVEPGGEDQDLPCMAAAMPFMRTLAASAAYCLGAPPDALELHSRSLPRFVYDAQGLSGTEPWDDGSELRLVLGFGAPDAMLAPPPDTGPWPRAPRIRWRAPAPVPEAYADEPWWSAEVPGAGHSLDKNAMGIAEPPRLIVLTGFLGAGKTSFLTRFIEQQAARNAFTAVIQNEIGAQGLDGHLLGQRYAVTEMDEGCVCCSLAGNLRPALAQILGTFQPDFVVLETTGWPIPPISSTSWPTSASWPPSAPSPPWWTPLWRIRPSTPTRSPAPRHAWPTSSSSTRPTSSPTTNWTPLKTTCAP